QMLPNDPNARASSYAAQAFIARAYFTQNKFSDAKTYIDKVIAGGFALDSTGVIFNTGNLNTNARNKETIFQIWASTTDYLPTVCFGVFHTVPFHPAQDRASDLFNQYLSADSAAGGYRYKLLYKRQSVGSAHYYFTRKYDLNTNLPVVIRLAEML